MSPKNKKVKIVLLVSTLLLIATGFKNYSYPLLGISEGGENIKVKHLNSEKYNGRNGKITYISIKKNYFNYKVVNQQHRNFDFYVNANYFAKYPIGEVISNGKKISPKRNGGGFFTSTNGTPRFYFGSHPKVNNSAQTHTIAIINGSMNTKIFKYRWAKYHLPRLVVGEDKKGNIVIIHSNINGGCSVESISKLSKSLGVENGLIFDGGASIEVGINTPEVNYHYQQVPDIIRSINNVPTPWVFIVGNKD